MSSSLTSAMRKSRSDFEARLTAAAAAFSHDSVLVPTSSITLYTLSAMDPPGRCAVIGHQTSRAQPYHLSRAEATRAHVSHLPVTQPTLVTEEGASRAMCSHRLPD